MSEIDKILEALKRSFLYQINCELTEKQSKTLLEHIDDLHFAVNENTELNARIAELKGVIEILEDQQREAKNHLIDKNLHIDSLYEEGYKLQQRIAELEAVIDQLIEVGDAVINAEPMWIAEEDKWETLVKDWKERKE